MGGRRFALLGATLVLAGMLAGCAADSSDSDDDGEVTSVARADISLAQPARGTTPEQQKLTTPASTAAHPIALEGDPNGDPGDPGDANENPEPTPWDGADHWQGGNPEPTPWAEDHGSMHKP